VPVGVTCRLCNRTDCEQRAFPPLREPLIIDENLRGVSIYAPTPPETLVLPRKVASKRVDR
jgi:predicted transcriptional regulator